VAVPLPLSLPLVLPEPLFGVEVPEVPFDGVEAPDGARFCVCVEASAAKFSREREAFAAVFSLITITMPLWQCFACAQYNQIGF